MLTKHKRIAELQFRNEIKQNCYNKSILHNAIANIVVYNFSSKKTIIKKFD